MRYALGAKILLAIPARFSVAVDASRKGCGPGSWLMVPGRDLESHCSPFELLSYVSSAVPLVPRCPFVDAEEFL